MSTSRPRPSFPAKLGKTAATAATSASNVSATSSKKLLKPAATRLGKTEVPVLAEGLGLDSQVVRHKMVLKLQEQGITDPRVIFAMGRIERHRFLDSALVNQAYEDTSLPIGYGQTISKPGVVSRMMELLLQAPSMLKKPSTQGQAKLGRILEIGTGCGYQAALLGQIASEVYSMERVRGLHDKARENLRPLSLPNVHLLLGDGMVGYPKGAPYAAIISAAGGDALPQAWLDQLALYGRLVAPMVAHGTQQALLVVDHTPQGFVHTVLEAVHFVPLKSGLA